MTSNGCVEAEELRTVDRADSIHSDVSHKVGGSYCCAMCCQSLPPASFPSRSGNRTKWKLTHGRLVCSACVACHFADDTSTRSPVHISTATSSCSVESHAADSSPSAGASPFTSCSVSPDVSARQSPFLLCAPTPALPNSPSPGGSAFAAIRGRHAYEVKSQNLKATKKHLRAAAGGNRNDGNLLFVDLLHWLKDVDGLPLDRLNVIVEDHAMPKVCRLDAWGLACGGCSYEHGCGLQLWRSTLWHGKRRSAKAPSWMRSPPYLPGLIEIPLAEVDAMWASAPEENRTTWGHMVQFVTFDGAIVWGRDLGEESGRVVRAFILEIQSEHEVLEDFELPPAEVDTFAWPSEIWQRVLQFLSIREVARVCVAVLADKSLTEVVEVVWDFSFLFKESLGTAHDGLSSFLSKARAVDFAEDILGAFPSEAHDEERVVNYHQVSHRQCPDKTPRTLTLSSEASSIALSNGLLAAGIDAEIKLIRRSDLRSCGSIALRKSRYTDLLALSSDGQTLATELSPGGGSPSEVRFHTTSDTKALPEIVQLGSGERLRSLQCQPSATSGMALGASNAKIFHFSVDPGKIVAFWNRQFCESSFITCTSCDPNTAVVLKEDAIEIWDLRTASGVAQQIQGEAAFSSLGFRDSQVDMPEPSTAVVGAVGGGLYQADWRASALTAIAPCSHDCDARSNAERQFLAIERGGVCLQLHAGFVNVWSLGGPPAMLLASVEAGSRVTAATVGPGAWAFAMRKHMAGSVKQEKPVVVMLDHPGENHSHGARLGRGAAASETGNRKAAKMFRRSEGNPHSQHAQSAGKSSRSARRGRR